jgi:hypothetical protein
MQVCCMQAHLSGGQWVELLQPEHPGIAEVKWCRNRFRPFLCIDPQVATSESLDGLHHVFSGCECV